MAVASEPPPEKVIPALSGSGGVKRRSHSEEIHSSASSSPSKQPHIQPEQATTEQALPGIMEAELTGELLMI